MSRFIAIGCGGAGNIILNSLSQETTLLSDPASQSFYYNTTSADLLTSFQGKKLILDVGGTGRNKKVGDNITIQYISGILDNIDIFYRKNAKLLKTDEIMDILLITSFGGGTGSSVIPVIVDFLKEIKSDNVKINLLGIFSSSKEGVSTLPNCVKTFNELYNDYVLTDKIDNFIVFDNEKFEDDYSIDTFDYNSINSIIVKYIELIFGEKSNPKVNSGGMQALDLNEKRRVLHWGKGVADFVINDFEDFNEDINITSSIFNAKYKIATAKAVSMRINFALPRDKVKQEAIDKANILIGTVRKMFKNAFFVFGYEFNSTRTEHISVELYINGMDFPKSIETYAKKAGKTVVKLKEKNKVMEIKEDLDF